MQPNPCFSKFFFFVRPFSLSVFFLASLLFPKSFLEVSLLFLACFLMSPSSHFRGVFIYQRLLGRGLFVSQVFSNILCCDDIMNIYDNMLYADCMGYNDDLWYVCRYEKTCLTLRWKRWHVMTVQLMGVWKACWRESACGRENLCNIVLREIWNPVLCVFQNV